MLFLIKDSTGEVRIIAQGEARMQSRIKEIADNLTCNPGDQLDYETFATQLLSAGFNIMGFRTIEISDEISQ